MRTVFLESDRLCLSPLSATNDLSAYAQWLNDQETTLYMGSGRFPTSVSALKKYIISYQENPDGILLGIFTKKPRKHIGNITLHMIDWRNRYGEIGIIIGDKKARGKGYAVEAIRLVVEHAFNKLNLNKVCAGMIEGNEASRKAFLRVGFKEEGRLRDHFYVNGAYHDCYRLGILKKEYFKAVRAG